MNERKYPWGELAVGETRQVGDTWTRSAAQVSLHAFRTRCRSLGYTDALMPRYACSYDLEHGIVTITRLEDGPLREASMRSRDALRERAAQIAAYQQASNEVDAWIGANVRRLARGEDRQMFPLDRLMAIKAIAPALAEEIAAIDCGVGEAPHRLRRATDKVYDTKGDRPADENLCARVASACKSSQSR